MDSVITGLEIWMATRGVWAGINEKKHCTTYKKMFSIMNVAVIDATDTVPEFSNVLEKFMNLPDISINQLKGQICCITNQTKNLHWLKILNLNLYVLQDGQWE